MINRTHTIPSVLDTLLALTLAAAASIWTWVLPSRRPVDTSPVTHAWFLHPAQSNGGWRYPDPVNSKI